MELLRKSAGICCRSKISGMMELLVVRCMSTTPVTELKPIRISNNLSFRPGDDAKFNPSERPIVLVYSWLAAKAQHIHKYGDFYLGKGFDVLHIKIEPLQLLWPRRAQGVISQIVDFVTDKPRRSQPILVHGFSVGGYLYGETLLKFTADPAFLQTMKKRVKGQIFDSPVDFEGVPRGVGMALSNVPIVQKSIKFSLEAYLTLFNKQVKQYYVRSSEMFYNNPLRCPSLVFYSLADKIGIPGPIEKVISTWKGYGVQVETKRWEKTPHVEHFRHDPVTYIGTINSFLSMIGLQGDTSANTVPKSTENIESPEKVSFRQK